MKLSSRVRLECRPLEDRVTPAGNVTTSFFGGTLTLTGVDVPTQWGANHQEILVANIGGGVIEVSGQNGTTIAGAASKQFTDVKALTIKTGLGSDKVTLFGLNLTGPVNINQGNGNNEVNITGGGSYASVSIINGQGSDSLNIGTGNGNTYTFAGGVTISNGSGGSSAVIGKSGLDKVTLNSLNVTGGDGLDTFFAEGQSITINGTNSFANGTGGSDIRWTAKSVTLGGAMTINNGVGDNHVSLGKSAVATTFSSKAITIAGNNGIGAVEVCAETSTITGNMSVTGKSGIDSLTVRGFDFVQSCKINGNLKLNYGAGDSSVSLDAANAMTVTGAMSITNLAGTDIIALGHLGKKVDLGSLRISNGNGGSTVSFVGDTTIAGELGISGGDGEDQVTTPAALFKVGGATKMNLGSGGSFVSLTATD